MQQEENRTCKAWICEARLPAPKAQNVEWLQKLVKASKIQRQDAERKLAELKGINRRK